MRDRGGLVPGAWVCRERGWRQEVRGPSGGEGRGKEISRKGKTMVTEEHCDEPLDRRAEEGMEEQREDSAGEWGKQTRRWGLEAG